MDQFKFGFTFSEQIAGFKKMIAQQANKKLTAVGLHMVGKIKLRLSTGKRSGRIYRVPGTKHVTYQASAPGESPAKRLGDLFGRMNYKVQKQGNTYRVGVGSPLIYAQWLEMGTRKMEARPFIRPEFILQKRFILLLLNKRWD